MQPTVDARVAVAELPRQIVAARPWLAELVTAVPRELGTKPTLVTFPLRDVAFPAKTVLPRMRATFSDLEVVELPRAKHFFVEDAPSEVADAIARRFGGSR